MLLGCMAFFLYIYSTTLKKQSEHHGPTASTFGKNFDKPNKRVSATAALRWPRVITLNAY